MVKIVLLITKFFRKSAFSYQGGKLAVTQSHLTRAIRLWYFEIKALINE